MTLNQGTSYLPESKYRRFVAVRPVVTFIFIILTLAVYIAQVVTEAQFGVDYPLQFGAKYGLEHSGFELGEILPRGNKMKNRTKVMLLASIWFEI